MVSTLRSRLAALAAAGFVVACGGGVVIGIGGDFDDGPPSVSLAVGTNSVVPGQALRLVAAASDENGIESVAFYRFDDAQPVLLARVTGPPWEWITAVPTDGRRQLQLFARATDGAGNTGDSGVVTVTVTP